MNIQIDLIKNFQGKRLLLRIWFELHGEACVSWWSNLLRLLSHLLLNKSSVHAVYHFGSWGYQVFWIVDEATPDVLKLFHFGGTFLSHVIILKGVILVKEYLLDVLFVLEILSILLVIWRRIPFIQLRLLNLILMLHHEFSLYILALDFLNNYSEPNTVLSIDGI